MNETAKFQPDAQRAFAPLKGTAGNAVVRLLFADVPQGVVYLYTGALIVLYLFVSVHTPMSVMADAPHDDGLFMSLGTYMSEGQWLGPFSQFTLMKGPGYPAFLALNNWLGTPISFAHALLHCAAVTFFVIVAHRFIRSMLLSGLLLTLLLWHPVMLSEPLLHVARDRIYGDQLLIILAALVLTLFNGMAWKRRLLLGAFGGAVLGWFWLTREEGVWVLPALSVLVLAAAWRAARSHQLRAFAGTVLIVLGTFAATQVGFRAVNLWAYGKFVGVDFKEANFQRALRALDSVRSGGTKPFVSMTYAAMKHVYAASPTFASLAPQLEGPERGWGYFGCPVYPSSCGEISSAFFMWALRDAAQRGGHFSSPSEASAFFGRIADEVEAACAQGTLECEPQLIAEMPPMTRQRYIDGLERYYGDAFHALLLTNFTALDRGGQSNGDEQALSRAVRFLNYPLHKPSSDASLQLFNYAISGWYYRSGSDWMSVTVKTRDGGSAAVRLDRGVSQDIATHFDDKLASLQRYVASVDCDDDCVLEVKTPEGDTVSATFRELRQKAPLGLAIGKGTFYVDTAKREIDAAYKVTAADRLAGRIRAVVFRVYKFLFFPVLVLGLLAFVLSSTLHWKRAFSNPCYVMALISWILVLSRFGLLLLTAATSLPGLEIRYFPPVYFMLVCASIFSCASSLQLSRTTERAGVGAS